MENPNEIKENSKIPKYLQLVDIIMADIREGKLKVGSRLPSINEISFEYYLSRDTVEKAFKELRARGIITSVKRRGYFISKTDFEYQKRIAFITNSITDYKRNIYEAFAGEMGEDSLVDVYVYNYDIRRLEIILMSNRDDYDHFMIIPFFKNRQHYLKAVDLMNQFPDQKLLILDNQLKGIKPVHSAITQDFEMDIREALGSLDEQLKAYERHYLVYPEASTHPGEVVKGFEIFCRMRDYEYEVVQELKPGLLHPGATFTLLDDTHLVEAIEFIREKNLELGKDVGLISYNETPLKRVLAGGISVISTDWEAMGKKAAEMINQQESGTQRVPFKVHLRNSLRR